MKLIIQHLVEVEGGKNIFFSETFFSHQKLLHRGREKLSPD
jgi:hypothetical protein